MRSQVSMKMLNSKLEELNCIMFYRTFYPRFIINHRKGFKGAYKISKITNAKGGEADFHFFPWATKDVCYDLLSSFIAGIEQGTK